MVNNAHQVVIQRLDDGYPEEPGEYKCTLCHWHGKGVARGTMTSHGYGHGKSLKVERLVAMKPRMQRKRKRKNQEGVPKAVIAQRDAQMRYKERKKVGWHR